jgi:LDH2 family malate/lactate/ureidoglycolate dehydrogenase
MMTGLTFAANDLRVFARDCYLALGVAADNAVLLADSLAQADLWGHQSHGLMRVFWYAKRMRSGATKIDAQPILDVDAGALAVLDGQDGVGQVVATKAMQEAIARAKRHGVGVVSCRNSGHFGTAMYFTRMAAQAGCVGMLTTNASPAMAPWGGREKMIGNNPWSLAAPAGKHPPIMLDLANTAVARGKIYLARQRGEPIPDGWAADVEGRPTSDPVAAIAGNIMPMAGHKGYAISLMMDVLSGVLSGSGFGADIVGPYMPEGRSGVGHFCMAVDIERIRPLSDFNSDMEAMIARLKSAPRAPGVDEIFYPGEMEARSDALLRQQGVSLPADTVAELDAGAAEIGVEKLSRRAH